MHASARTHKCARTHTCHCACMHACLLARSLARSHTRKNTSMHARINTSAHAHARNARTHATHAMQRTQRTHVVYKCAHTHPMQREPRRKSFFEVFCVWLRVQLSSLALVVDLDSMCRYLKRLLRPPCVGCYSLAVEHAVEYRLACEHDTEHIIEQVIEHGSSNHSVAVATPLYGRSSSARAAAP